ncbi:MAG TPA: hypothetical protein VHQ45_17335 [Gemmatimonadaceae bacterium]|nr:hypothetical protein [Gemmatimonadaceae bacterium]
MPVHAAGFKAWLYSADSLSENELVAAREHLFAIISEDAKTRARAGRPPFPPEGDTALAGLFALGHELGLPGAGLVAAALDAGVAARPLAPIATPGFTLHFDSLYTLTADANGWMIRFPHYFMIGTATRQRMANGSESSIAVLSTLFAKHATADALGASQATVLIVSAPTPAAELAAFWLAQVGLQPTETTSVPTPSALGAYRGLDAATGMVRELVVFAPAGRTVLFLYIGREGTHEANRPHFLNLLETLRVRPTA